MANGGSLPPGPRLPKLVQTVAWWSRPTAYLERCRHRWGHRFTLRPAGQRPFVFISDPDELKRLFTAPAEILHPGEGARILEPFVGARSMMLLDRDQHLRQRRLVLPAFHGERLARLAGLVAEIADRNLRRLPRVRSAPIHPPMQALTMEVMLRVVFGFEPGPRMEAMRAALTEMTEIALSPVSLFPPAQRAPLGRGPWGRFLRSRARADELIHAQIAARRRDRDEREDMLAALLEARHEDGTPMSDQEIRDELMTLLIAGHETTATSLAWAVERLTREPDVLRRLSDEAGAGEGDEYMTATIRELLRRRPVVPNAAPRTTIEPFELGGIRYPPGVHLIACSWLVHHDPSIYPDPFAFRPERFLGREPGTYTWIPFGGGRRRCIGASFAQLEIAIVLRELLRRYALEPTRAPIEPTRRRGITSAPGGGAVVTLRARGRSAAGSGAPAVPAV